MTDALAGHTDAVVEDLTLLTAGNYKFFGGGAGDDGQFRKTHVFAGTQAANDAVVALEILSEQLRASSPAFGLRVHFPSRRSFRHLSKRR